MKKFISKNPVINFVIGGIFIAGFLLTFFLTDWLEDFVRIFVAALIIIFSTLRYFKDYKTKTNNNVLLILTGEFAIALLLSALLIFETVGISLALGLTLYLRGFIYFLIMQLLGKKARFEKFLLYIAILTLGAYVLFSGLPLSQEELSYILLALGLIIGIFYVIAGISIVQSKKPEKPKQTKSNK